MHMLMEVRGQSPCFSLTPYFPPFLLRKGPLLQVTNVSKPPGQHTLRHSPASTPRPWNYRCRNTSVAHRAWVLLFAQQALPGLEHTPEAFLQFVFV